MKKILILLLLICTTSCMINEDWVVHDIELDTTKETITVDGKTTDAISYVIAEDKMSVSIYYSIYIEDFTWHWNILNEFDNYADKTITYNNGITEILIEHNFNKYPMKDNKPFKGSTYLKEEYIHFITNIIKI